MDKAEVQARGVALSMLCQGAEAGLKVIDGLYPDDSASSLAAKRLLATLVKQLVLDLLEDSEIFRIEIYIAQTKEGRVG